MGKHLTANKSGIQSVSTPWREIVLVCRKCSKRLDGGFGDKGKHPLRQALRDALRASGRRRDVRIVEIGCVGLCPKGAVTVSRTSRPGDLLVIPRGIDMDEVVARLAEPPPPPPPSPR